MLGNASKTWPRHQREWFAFADWSRAIRGVPLKSHQRGASLKSFESGVRHQVVLTRHKRLGTGTAALGQVEEAGTIRRLSLPSLAAKRCLTGQSSIRGFPQKNQMVDQYQSSFWGLSSFAGHKHRASGPELNSQAPDGE